MITLSSTAKKEPIPPLVKVNAVARLLGVSRNTVHNLIICGDLTASTVNPTGRLQRQHTRITRQSLLKFYKKRFGHDLNHALTNPFEN